MQSQGITGSSAGPAAPLEPASRTTVVAAGAEFVWDEHEECLLKNSEAPVRLDQPAE